MRKRGPKLKPAPTWTANLAYAVGLIATDGCLYNDGRHINFTSKDRALIETFKTCLGLNNRIGSKTSGFSDGQCFYIQFGNVSFYNFLIAIGLTPAKSKTLEAIKVPRKIFADFLRGLFDGDGSLYSYWDKRWRSSFLFYLQFISSSKHHLEWLRNKLYSLYNVSGHGVDLPHSGVYQLKYAKGEAKKLLNKMYHSDRIPCLERKRKKVYNVLAIQRNMR